MQLYLSCAKSVAKRLYNKSLFNGFLFLLVPNAPPTNVKGHNTSSTSIFVQWGNVPVADQGGKIKKYTVTYKALPNGDEQTKEVIAPITEVTLTGLNEYTNYSITVFASTVKGAGNVSEPIIVITDQDSKYFSLCLIVSVIFDLILDILIYDIYAYLILDICPFDTYWGVITWVSNYSAVQFELFVTG